jgi:hypothetical protein
VNAYRPTHPLVTRRNLRSATTVAAQANGQRLRGVRDILEGQALHHDFTNRLLIEHGEAVPEFTPRQAGRALAHMARKLDIAFFEYFLTDLAGHAQHAESACDQVRRIGGFLEGVLEEVDFRQTHVLVCSDHGNLEDLSVRTHTRNPVPTLIWGPRAEELGGGILTIQDIAPAVLKLFDCGKQTDSISDFGFRISYFSTLRSRSPASIPDCRLPIADCRLPIPDCRLPIADCRLPIPEGSP